MKFKCHVVKRELERNEKGETIKNTVISSLAIGRMAILVDSATAEATDIDALQLSGFLYDRCNGLCRIELRLGGVDSKGKFHPSKDHQPALFSMNREGQHASFFKKHIDGKSVFDLDEILTALYVEGGVAVAAKNVWAVTDGELEIELDHEKIKAQPN